MCMIGKNYFRIFFDRSIVREILIRMKSSLCYLNNICNLIECKIHDLFCFMKNWIFYETKHSNIFIKEKKKRNTLKNEIYKSRSKHT